MPGDLQGLIAGMPDGLKGIATAALFLVSLIITTVTAVAAIRRGRADEAHEETHDHHDATALLDAGPVRDIVTALATLALHAPLQTEALKVSAAALGVLAKTVEEDFDERRVHREVDRQVAIERYLAERATRGRP